MVVLVALAKPLGAFMARVYEGERTFLSPVLGPSSDCIYRVARHRPDARDRTGSATRSACCSSICIGFVVVYLLQRLQGVLPLNPAGLRRREPGLVVQHAVSFATNTNWQGYVGEATMSYLTQMLGLAVQNFLSAASGMAVLVALIRGFARRQAERDRQLLGRLHAQHALHPAAAVAAARDRADVAGRRAELSRRTRQASWSSR